MINTSDIAPIYYSIDPPKKLVKDEKLITNVFRRILLRRGYSEDRYQTVEKYTIKDGDSPESIALAKYGNVSFWWVVLVVNPQILSTRDWPFSQNHLDKYMDVNFGDSQYDIVPTENDFDLPFRSYSNGNFSLIEHHTLRPSNDEQPARNLADVYRADNEQKRNIRIITPELLFDFIKEYKQAVQNFESKR